VGKPSHLRNPGRLCPKQAFNLRNEISCRLLATVPARKNSRDHSGLTISRKGIDWGIDWKWLELCGVQLLNLAKSWPATKVNQLKLYEVLKAHINKRSEYDLKNGVVRRLTAKGHGHDHHDYTTKRPSCPRIGTEAVWTKQWAFVMSVNITQQDKKESTKIRPWFWVTPYRWIALSAWPLGIENSLYWQPEVTIDEDQSRMVHQASRPQFLQNDTFSNQVIGCVFWPNSHLVYRAAQRLRLSFAAQGKAMSWNWMAY